MSDPENIPVLIVGGGIVGLSASLFLSHLGIRSLLVERHTGTSIHPRSRTLNGRTMELYRSVGIGEAIRAAGAELNPSKGVYRGETLVKVVEANKRSEEGAAQRGLFGSGITTAISPTEGARGTQDLVEPVLLAAARAQPHADVRFNTECVALEQDETQVTATITDRASKKKLIVHADYLLAADGAGSPTRQILGIATTGPGVLGHLLNILFEADLRELVQGREFSLCRIDRPEVRGLFTSINNTNRWVFHLCYDPAKGEKVEDYPPDRCETLIKAALGLPDIEITIKSILPWQSAVRVAETFQQGRVFLAGDAAHQMPPWGGQGANSGIADVHNLAWKLAAVLRGQALPALLGTYSSERLPVGRLAAEESGAAADEHGLMSTSWTALLQMIRRGPRLLGYGIPWFFLAWLFDVNGRPGTRCPHIWVQETDQGESKPLSTLDLCDKRFVLLTGADGSAWRDAASKVSARLNIELTAYCLGESPDSDLLDPARQWESLAGISARGALLVRPDGFVAWRAYSQPNKLEEPLQKALECVLCR